MADSDSNSDAVEDSGDDKSTDRGDPVSKETLIDESAESKNTEPAHKLANPDILGSEFETGEFQAVDEKDEVVSDCEEETDRAPDEDVRQADLPTKVLPKAEKQPSDPYDDLETRDVTVLSDDWRKRADEVSKAMEDDTEVIDEWDDDGGLADSVQSSMLPEESQEVIGPVVNAGREAFHSWAALRLEQRLKHFDDLRNEMVLHRNDYVPSLASALGRPMVETLCGEYLPVLDALHTIEETVSPLLVSTPGVEAGIGVQGAQAQASMKPWGVVLIAAPTWGAFGVPLVMAIDALATGNAVIICGQDIHPRANDMMQRLLRRAEFPDGLVQVVTGGTETLVALCNSCPDKVISLRDINCTERLGGICAAKGISFSASRNTKDTMIVAGDADLERAATAAVWGAYAAGGATLGSIERIIVADELFDEFRVKFIDSLRNMNSHHAQLASLKDVVDLRRFNHVLEDLVTKGGRVTYPAGEKPGRWIHWKGAVLENVGSKCLAATQRLQGPGVALYRTGDCLEELRVLLKQAPVGQLAVLGTPGKRAREELLSMSIPALLFGEPWVFGVTSGGSMTGPSLIRTLCGPALMLRPTIQVTSSEDGNRVSWFPYADDKAHALMDTIETIYSTNFGKRLKGNIKRAVNSSQRRILNGDL